MKRFLSVLVLAVLLFSAQASPALEAGEELEICETDGEYTILASDQECGGELLIGTVQDVQDGVAVVNLGDGEMIEVPVE